MGDRGATGGLGTVQGPMEELLGPHSHGWGQAAAQRRVHIPGPKQGNSKKGNIRLMELPVQQTEGSS